VHLAIVLFVPFADAKAFRLDLFIFWSTVAYLFIYSFIHSFIHSFIYLFIYLFCYTREYTSYKYAKKLL